MDIAVDCCLLLRLKISDTEVIRFVLRILDPDSDHRVLLDIEQAIEHEYVAHLNRRDPSDLYTEIVLQLLYSPANFYKYSGKPCSRLAYRLEEIGFHQKDRPYVGVASRSAHKTVASIDGRSFQDLSKCRCLQEEFGLRVLNRDDLGTALD